MLAGKSWVRKERKGRRHRAATHNGEKETVMRNFPHEEKNSPANIISRRRHKRTFLYAGIVVCARQKRCIVPLYVFQGTIPDKWPEKGMG